MYYIYTYMYIYVYICIYNTYTYMMHNPLCEYKNTETNVTYYYTIILHKTQHCIRLNISPHLSSPDFYHCQYICVYNMHTIIKSSFLKRDKRQSKNHCCNANVRFRDHVLEKISS